MPTPAGDLPHSSASSTPQTTRMPQFHRLTVADVRRETGDAVSIGFSVPPQLAETYRFAPGQYLTLRATIDGEDLRRSYSICSSPTQGELRVAVKRVADGVFSAWVNDALAPGDSIDVMTPTGRFGLSREQRDGQVHVGFAAGSGITPILSIVLGILEAEPASHFFLYYGNRSTRDILFRATLEELKDRFPGRFAVFHVLSREDQDLSILNGHLDDEKVRLLLTAQLPAALVDNAYVCGPADMIDSVGAVLGDLGIPAARVHVERFVSSHDGRPRPRPAVAAEAPPAHVATLTVDGKRRDVPVAAGETILDAALRAGMDLPFACKGGMCSTCRAKVEEGSVEMEVNYSLEPWETEAGFVLTCQAHPTTPRVVVDFDRM